MPGKEAMHSAESLAESAPTLSDPDERPAGAEPRVPLGALSNCSFLSRSIAFRVKGYSQLKSVLLAEERSDPSSLKFALDAVQDIFLQSTATRATVSSYLNSVAQEGLDAVVLRSTTENLLWHTPNEELPSSISEFTNALAFNDFFPMPDSLRKSVREVAIRAADLIAEHPAFAARLTTASGPASAEQLAPHLVQILLSCHFVWFFSSIRVSIDAMSRSDGSKAHGSNDSSRFIRGATAVAADSVCHYWNCHFIQRLLSKIDLPEVTTKFSEALARTTIVPQYFKKNEWNNAYPSIMAFLDGLERVLDNAKTGLCPILNAQPFCKDVFARLEREHFPTEPIEPVESATLTRAPKSLLEGSTVSVVRYGTDPSEQDLYTLRWVSGRTYSVSVMGGPSGPGETDYARIEFLVSAATTPVRVFGLGEVYTCEVDSEDSSILSGVGGSTQSVATAVAALYHQLQRDLQEAFNHDPAAIGQCKDFPSGVALELFEEGYRLHCSNAAIAGLASFFAHWPEVQATLLSLPSGDGAPKILAINYADSDTREGVDDVVTDPVSPSILGSSSTHRAARSEVSQLLHKHAFKFWQFFAFLRTNWGVELEMGGIHKHLRHNGHHFAVGQDMRSPDEPLRNDIAFKIFARLHIPLEEVADRLRE